MEITSPILEAGEEIPVRYSCLGNNISPPLTFNDIPPECATLTLFLIDLDALGETFYHWVVWNLPADCDEIDEDALPEEASEGLNSKEEKGYTGPCPAAGIHRYLFKVYALSHSLDLGQETTGEELDEYIEGLIIDEAELTVFFGSK